MLVQAITTVFPGCCCSKPRLLTLSTVDLAIIALYFVAVLGIGFYLKRYTKTGEDFFLAGREMTAWIAGLSFLSANLGSLELMGWAAAAYQYGILATHWYWIGAIPAMLFLGIVMMPFYYISKTHSVPGYLKLRFGEPARALSAISFGFMTVLMSGINMYSMALVMKVVLGWDIHFSIWVSSLTVARLCRAGRPALGHLQRGAAVRPDLAGRAADLHPRPDRSRRLERHGGAHPRSNFPAQRLHPPVEHARLLQRQPHGHPLDRHRLRPGLRHLLAATGPPTSWWCSASSPPRTCAPPSWRPSSAPPSRCGAVHRHSARPARPRGAARCTWWARAQAVATGGHSYNEVLPLMLARYCGPGLLGLGITALIAGFMSGMAGNVSAFATVWTYDIYRACIKKDATDAHYVSDGPLVHHPRRAGQHRHRVPGDAVPQHHGLRAGALQLLHRAAVRHGAARHAVEARHAGGRILGPAGGHGVVHRHVGLGEARSRRAAIRRAFARTPRTWPRTCTAPSGRGSSAWWSRWWSA